MDILDRFALAPNVRMIAIDKLHPQKKARINGKSGDILLIRDGGRDTSKLISPAAANLVKAFSNPISIIDAIRQTSVDLERDPEDLLVESFPLIKQLVNNGFLTDRQNFADESLIQPFQTGHQFGDFKITKLVQSYEDVAVYRATHVDVGSVALKIANDPNDRNTARRLSREAEIVRMVGGRPAPDLVGSGVEEGRAFLAVEWIEGAVITVYAEKLRRSAANPNIKLMEIGGKVLKSMAALHESGVIHGDIHPQNFIMTPDENVIIIDYGLSRTRDGKGALARSRRGGVSFFFEPEYASARLNDRNPPKATIFSDQYATAALLFQVITGEQYLAFSYDKNRMMSQISEDTPRRFIDCGVMGLGATQKVLIRMLAKRESERFKSTSAAHAAFCKAAKTDIAPKAVKPEGPDRRDGRESLLVQFGHEVIDIVLEFDPKMLDSLPLAPKCSVHSGASGMAYFLYRAACHLDDASLLSSADRWSHAAIAASGDKDAYLSEPVGVTPDTVGKASIFHSPTGSYFVQALISQAMGDFVKVNESINGFVSSANLSDSRWQADFFSGAVGILNCCTTLMGVVTDEASFADPSPIAILGEELHDDLLNMVHNSPLISIGKFRKLGMAHGWAGVLYALMRWRQANGLGMHQYIQNRFEEIRALAVSTEAGLCWPSELAVDNGIKSPKFVSSWCNGTAGHLMLWTMFDRLTGEDNKVTQQIANELVAAITKERTPFLCCGLAGASYALLARYRLTGDKKEFAAAQDAAERGLAGIRSPKLPFLSLYRGRLGLATLAFDLQQPKYGSMPLVESEHLDRGTIL